MRDTCRRYKVVSYTNQSYCVRLLDVTILGWLWQCREMIAAIRVADSSSASDTGTNEATNGAEKEMTGLVAFRSNRR